MPVTPKQVQAAMPACSAGTALIAQPASQRAPDGKGKGEPTSGAQQQRSRGRRRRRSNNRSDEHVRDLLAELQRLTAKLDGIQANQLMS